MTPARDAAELLGQLFPDKSARIKKREWPAMAVTTEAADRPNPVPSAHEPRSDRRPLYMLGITAVAVFAAIVIGIAMMRRASEKQIPRGHQRKVTSSVAEPGTKANLPPKELAAQWFGVHDIRDAEVHASSRNPEEQVGLK
ncbi:hypothetical protein MRX96_013376 [Rhipicephalus microplus]